MTHHKDRKQQIRGRMKAEQVPYTEAARRIEAAAQASALADTDSRPEEGDCDCADCFAPGGCQYDGVNPGKGRDDPEWEDPDVD